MNFLFHKRKVITMENIKVTALINHYPQWSEEFKVLRGYVNTFELDEEVKWMQPCFCKNGKNIVLLHGFKEYFAILFFKGALINDTHNKLIQQTENVQAGRQLRFKNLQEVLDQKNIILDYIKQEIDIEDKGLQVEMKPTQQFDMVEELQERFDNDEDYKEAFYKLTPGRQRAYLMFFSQAKQAPTRIARIEKMRDKVFDGKGPQE